MAYVSVPKDLTAIKSKLILGLTAKQLGLIGAGLAVAVPVFFFVNPRFEGVTEAAFLAMLCIFPFAFFGFFERDGLPADRWLYVFLRKIVWQSKRPYKTQNFVSFFPFGKDSLKDVAGLAGPEVVGGTMVSFSAPKPKKNAGGKEEKTKKDSKVPDKKSAKKPGILDLLFGKGKKDSPKTAQETLPFKTIYRDGVCEMPGGLYSKSIVFGDINYQLSQPEDQQNIFNRYCKFLNYFDSSLNLQLSFVNRFGNLSDLKKLIEITCQGDDFDRLRCEYSEMIQEQMEKGNNGLVRMKFATITVQARDVKTARARLSNIEKDVLANFKRLGVNAASLDGKDRVVLLYNQLHPDGNVKLKFEWPDLSRTGMSVKDVICPSSFDFTSNLKFKIGQHHAKAMHIKISASEVPDDMLSQILNLNATLSVGMHLRTIDQAEAIKQIKRKITDIDAMKINYQKKAARGGYGTDIMPSDIRTFGEEAKNFLTELQSRNERMFIMTFVILFIAEDEDKLDRVIESAKGIVQKDNCELMGLDFQQEQGLVSSLALGKNEIEIERTLTTSSTAIFIPFTTSELFEEGETMYYGLNALSNNLIMCNRKNLINPNGLILGTPGSGKSFAAKREIVNAFLITSDDVIIIDPEAEYYPLTERLKGQVVKISQNSSNYINPFDITEHYGDGEDSIAFKSNFILSLCELIVGGRYGLQPEEKSIIDRCVHKMYNRYFLSPAPESMPTFGDLHGLLIEEAAAGNEHARHIAASMEMYVTGSLNIFNNRSNVNLSNRLVCFDIKELQSHLKSIGMLVIQDAVWSRVSSNRQIKRKTWLYIDEFHLLLKDAQTAQYSVEIWKRFRKWGGIPTGITQNVEDLLASSEVSNIFKNTPFIMMLNQAAGDREILARSLGISEEQLSFVTQSDAGQGLLFFGNVTLPFVDRFPKNTLYYVMTSKLEEVEGKPLNAAAPDMDSEKHFLPDPEEQNVTSELAA